MAPLYAMMAMQAAGTVSSAISQVSQGQAANAAGKANADYLESYADSLRGQSAAESADTMRKGREVLGEQRAAIAQSGTGFGGTNATLAEQSTRDLYLDAGRIRYQGYLDAKGADDQATLTRWAGKQAKKSALWGAGLSILAGTSISLAGNYSALTAPSAGASNGPVTPTYSSMSQRGA